VFLIAGGACRLADSAAAALSVSSTRGYLHLRPPCHREVGAYARPVTKIEPTEDVIASLLRDPECPKARSIGTIGERWIPVPHFLLFARSRGVATTALESRTDAYVESIDGRRERVLDPWSAIPNLLRRLAGRLPSAPEYAWVVPTDDADS